MKTAAAARAILWLPEKKRRKTAAPAAADSRREDRIRAEMQWESVQRKLTSHAKPATADLTKTANALLSISASPAVMHVPAERQNAQVLNVTAVSA